MLTVVTQLALLLAPVLSMGPQEPASSPPKKVAIVLFDRVELLDFAGPGEVFSSVRLGRSPAFEVYTVGETLDPIVSQRFLTLTPSYTFENCPTPDIVIMPGGGVPVESLALRSFLREGHAERDLTMSVCNGALALGGAGLLAGLEVTSHASALERLQIIEPEASVHSNRRFVDHGHVLTSAGVSAGIDGALQVVTRLHGIEVAHETADYMEYDWRPDEIRRLHKEPGIRVDGGVEFTWLRRIHGDGLDKAVAAYREDAEHGAELPEEAKLNRAGYALQRTGKAERARHVFEFVATVHGDSANACDSLAENLILLGRLEEALLWTKRALERLPRDEKIEPHLRALVESTCIQRREELERLLAGAPGN